MNQIKTVNNRASVLVKIALVIAVSVFIATAICNACLEFGEKRAEQLEKDSVDSMECAATDIVYEKARSGDCIAQCELGRRYLSGDRIERNLDKGVLMVLASAEQGYWQAKIAADNILGWYRNANQTPLWERDAVVGCRMKRVGKFSRREDGGPNGRFVQFVRRTNGQLGKRAVASACEASAD